MAGLSALLIVYVTETLNSFCHPHDTIKILKTKKLSRSLYNSILRILVTLSFINYAAFSKHDLWPPKSNFTNMTFLNGYGYNLFFLKFSYQWCLHWSSFRHAPLLMNVFRSCFLFQVVLMGEKRWMIRISMFPSPTLPVSHPSLTVSTFLPFIKWIIALLFRNQSTTFYFCFWMCKPFGCHNQP